MKKVTDLFKLKMVLASSILIVTVIVLGSPVSALAATLTRQLQLGMRGADVSSLQTFLAADSTVYPQGLVTGYYGPLTQAAVVRFQAKNGIATVGRVGPQTMAVINAQMGSGGPTGTDRIAPTIYGVATSTVGSTTATMSWNTNENSSSLLYYSPTPLSMIEASANTGLTINNSSILGSVSGATFHTVNLSSLSPNTTYYYAVYVRDSSGNETITWPATFRTNQ